MLSAKGNLSVQQLRELLAINFSLEIALLKKTVNHEKELLIRKQLIIFVYS